MDIPAYLTLVKLAAKAKHTDFIEIKKAVENKDILKP